MKGRMRGSGNEGSIKMQDGKKERDRRLEETKGKRRKRKGEEDGR